MLIGYKEGLIGAEKKILGEGSFSLSVLPCTVLCRSPLFLQARFWVQVMRDLRHGVKLKKVEERTYDPLPFEFQLTPYEMLMDDIRSKRYKLRKVMVSLGLRVVLG